MSRKYSLTENQALYDVQTEYNRKERKKSGRERIEGKIEHNMSMKRQYPCQKETQTIILKEEAIKP
jgi:hypothetical protein